MSAPCQTSNPGSERSIRWSDCEKDQRAILETLCAYVRENSPLQLSADKKEAEKSRTNEVSPPPAKRSDVQAAVTIIGRRPELLRMRSQREGWNLDFRETNLAGYDFSNLNYDQSDFSGSILNGARMTNASFANSVFAHSNLSSVDMTNANFQAVTFKNCNVVRARLEGTNLNYARIAQTDLREANVVSFSICGANLDEAFSRHALESLKTLGANYINSKEVVGIFDLFQKATHDKATNVSQAVHDILLMSKAKVDNQDINNSNVKTAQSR